MVEDYRDALSIICSRGRVKDCQLGEQKKGRAEMTLPELCIF